MPISSLQAAISALIVSAVGLVVGLGIMSPHDGGEVVAFVTVAVSSVFVIGNAIIHHGVTTSAPGEDASLPKSKGA